MSETGTGAGWGDFLRRQAEEQATDEATARERQAKPNGYTTPGGGVSLDDFSAYMPMHHYIFEPTGAPWPAGSVNARLPKVKLTDASGKPVLGDDGEQVELSASAWLDRFRPVEQMTWAPGLPPKIHGRLILDGGWIDRAGITVFNLYRRPRIDPGDPDKAGPWLDHVAYVYPNEASHIISWLAHRVQRPQDKINHALVLGGPQGVGKDTLLEPVKLAVGPWNFTEVSPQQVLGRFNGFLKSVIMRISEARDLGEFDRFKFYDHMKSYTAAPPDTLRVDEKFLHEYTITNCCGVIITSNHKTDGIFLSADDRRHFVAWSDRTKEDERFGNGYWTRLYRWYAEGGVNHVAAYLAQHSFDGFDAKAPPPKTPAFWAIVDAGAAPEEAELADILDQLGKPVAVTLSHIQRAAEGEFHDWLIDRRNRRAIPHRLEKCGYVPVRNPDDTHDGQWRIESKRQTVYASNRLSVRDQIAAARALGRW